MGARRARSGSVRWGWLAATGSAVIVVFVVVVWVAGRWRTSWESVIGCTSAQPQVSVLLIGNSYTERNGLGSVLASVMCKSGIGSNVRVDSLTAGGVALPSWVNSSTEHRMSGHGVVVFQDQSQIPGFGADDPDYEASLSAIQSLAGAATSDDARVVLFQTWGHEYGDRTNAAIYPTYTAMQGQLIDGYEGYRESLTAGPAPDAVVSPVGVAWEYVFDHSPSIFGALYASDGSHPSRAGTYLAALVLAQTISGQQLPTQLWAPSGLAPAEVTALQTAARSVEPA